jgi:hypothetical protein
MSAKERKGEKEILERARVVPKSEWQAADDGPGAATPYSQGLAPRKMPFISGRLAVSRLQSLSPDGTGDRHGSAEQTSGPPFGRASRRDAHLPRTPRSCHRLIEGCARGPSAGRMQPCPMPGRQDASCGTWKAWGTTLRSTYAIHVLQVHVKRSRYLHEVFIEV